MNDETPEIKPESPQSDFDRAMEIAKRIMAEDRELLRMLAGNVSEEELAEFLNRNRAEKTAETNGSAPV